MKKYGFLVWVITIGITSYIFFQYHSGMQCVDGIDSVTRKGFGGCTKIYDTSKEVLPSLTYLLGGVSVFFWGIIFGIIKHKK